MPDKEGSDDEKKSTKSVVNKKQKQIMNQEDFKPLPIDKMYDQYEKKRSANLKKGPYGDVKTGTKFGKSFSDTQIDSRGNSKQTKKMSGVIRNRLMYTEPIQRAHSKFKSEKNDRAQAAYIKSLMGEEGYDHLRDQGRVRPSKDKKDATTMPPSKEMKKTQKVNKGPSAFERVKAKYGKSVMNVGKKKVKEELDLTQVAEAFGGYIIEISDEMRQRAFRKSLKKREEARQSGDKDELRKRERQVQTFANASVRDRRYKQQGIEDLEQLSVKSQSAFAGEPKDQSALRQVIGTARRARPDLFGNPDATPPSEKPPTIQDLMRQQGVNTDSKSDPKNDPTSRYDYDQLSGKEKEEYMNIKKEVEASKNQKPSGFAGDTPPSKEKIKPVKQRKFTTGSGADAKDRGDKVTYGQPDEVKPKQGKLSKLATAAAANPAAALVAYDLGKGIIGKISKLRAPAVVGGKAGFRSAGGYQAT